MGKTNRPGEKSLREQVKEQIRERGIKPIRSAEELAFPDWPEDEDVEEFLEFIYDLRRRDRAV